jgi:hypothetical protein
MPALAAAAVVTCQCPCKCYPSFPPMNATPFNMWQGHWGGGGRLQGRREGEVSIHAHTVAAAAQVLVICTQ